MANQLIKIEINSGGIQTVNARFLHLFLESKQDFSTWIKSRIKQYGFAEGQDYVCLHKKMEANNATMIEYHLSLDMGKEISMVEKTDKGRQARQYFIKCEKVAKQASIDLSDPDNVLKIAYAWKKEKDQRKQLEISNKKMQPKAQAFDIFLDTKGLFTLTGAMKVLGLPPNKSIDKLRSLKILYKLDGCNVPMEKYRVKDFFKVQMKLNHQQQKSYPQAYVTETGLAFISEKLNPPSSPVLKLEMVG